jgi:hypothetical protein
MSEAFSVHGNLLAFGWKNQVNKGNFKGIGLDGVIILKWILNK